MPPIRCIPSCHTQVGGHNGAQGFVRQGRRSDRGVVLKADNTVEVAVKDGPVPVLHFQSVEDAEKNSVGTLDIVSPRDDTKE